jgi:DNA-binding transcriptional LysR family regulator
MDQLKAMRTFVEVAKRGSFAGAAKSLGLSTSSVSRLVMDLEDWLGAPVLRRSPRTLALTSAGERFLERCAAIVDAADHLREDARALNDRPRGLLHVAAAAIPARQWITPLLPAFLSEFPDVRVQLHLQDRPVNLAEEGIDVALRIGELPDSSMIARKCADVHVRLVASPAFLERHGRPESVDTLSAYPCLLDLTGTGRRRWPIGRALSLDGPVSANDGEIIRQMALAGLGLAFLPDFFVDEDIAAGRLIELFADEIDVGMGMYLLFPARRQITPAARAFVDFLMANMKK